MINTKKDILILSNSIKGINRSHNQDDTLIIEDNKWLLFFLFDGVSSLKMSIDYIQICKDYINKNYKKYLQTDVDLSGLMYNMHKFTLKQGIRGLSTCSAVCLQKKGDKGYIFNIGDSRIYEYSNQYLEQLTEDDSLIGNKNVLTKCLGSLDMTMEDFVQKNIIFKYGLLLCSDGFYALMDKNKRKYFSILQYKRASNILKAFNRLQVNQNQDDSTYILIRKNGI